MSYLLSVSGRTVVLHVSLALDQSSHISAQCIWQNSSTTCTVSLALDQSRHGFSLNAHSHTLPQEPSDEAVREELIRKHFTTRIAELNAKVSVCITTHAPGTSVVWPCSQAFPVFTCAWYTRNTSVRNNSRSCFTRETQA